MPRFSRSFLFPDVNVWIALTYGGHIHHRVARAWFEEVDMEERVCFCRFTQLSLLRLLTTQAIMGTDEVMTQAQAWQAFDLWLTDRRVLFLEEPPILTASSVLFPANIPLVRRLGPTPTLRPLLQSQVFVL